MNDVIDGTVTIGPALEGVGLWLLALALLAPAVAYLIVRLLPPAGSKEK